MNQIMMQGFFDELQKIASLEKEAISKLKKMILSGKLSPAGLEQAQKALFENIGATARKTIAAKGYKLRTPGNLSEAALRAEAHGRPERADLFRSFEETGLGGIAHHPTKTVLVPKFNKPEVDASMYNTHLPRAEREMIHNLTLKHEADEVKYLKDKRPVATHASPEVVLRESGLLRYAPKRVRRIWRMERLNNEVPALKNVGATYGEPITRPIGEVADEWYSRYPGRGSRPYSAPTRSEIDRAARYEQNRKWRRNQIKDILTNPEEYPRKPSVLDNLYNELQASRAESAQALKRGLI